MKIQFGKYFEGEQHRWQDVQFFLQKKKKFHVYVKFKSHVRIQM